MPLDDAYAKLRRAKEHLDALRQQVEPFIERDAHSFSVEVDADEGEYTFYVDGLEDPDADWGLIVGDCITNARAALDYVMVQIAALVTGQAPRDITDMGFPMYDSSAKFSSNRGIAKARENPLLNSYLTRVEELQAYNRGNVAIWGADQFGMPLMHGLPIALERLHLLSNIDKHRVIHALWVCVDFMESFQAAPVPPPEFVELLRETSGAALENGAQVGKWRFVTPLPFEWEPDQVQMKASFPLMATLDAQPAVMDVLETLSFSLWGVEFTLAIFAPVFSGLQPPLPVTAIPNWG